MRRTQLAALTIIASLLLTACGQKGPLYLTDEQAARAQEAATLPADQEKKKSDAATTE